MQRLTRILLLGAALAATAAPAPAGELSPDVLRERHYFALGSWVFKGSTATNDLNLPFDSFPACLDFVERKRIELKYVHRGRGLRISLGCYILKGDPIPE